MTKAKPFFGILLFCLGGYLLATPPTNSITESKTCRCLIHTWESKEAHLQALRDYEKAFELSFDANWPEASEASSSAAVLDHSNTHWNIDAESFYKEYIKGKKQLKGLDVN